jgi:hypothetical protein
MQFICGIEFRISSFPLSSSPKASKDRELPDVLPYQYFRKIPAGSSAKKDVKKIRAKPVCV